MGSRVEAGEMVDHNGWNGAHDENDKDVDSHDATVQKVQGSMSGNEGRETGPEMGRQEAN